MPIEKSALVTGAASGIGAELSKWLAGKGFFVTVADISFEGAVSVVTEIRQSGGSAQAVECDIRDARAQQAMFDQHVDRCGRLEVVCLNAGILEKGSWLSSEGGPWQETLDVDLTAQITGAKLAVRAMEKTSSQGVLMFTASAGGIFPMPEAPVYAAAKAGLINFALSITPSLIKRGIRVCTLCPQFVETPLTRGAIDAIEKKHGGGEAAERIKVGLFGGLAGQPLLSTAHVVKWAGHLLEDQSQTGKVLLVHANGKAYEHNFHKGSLRRLAPDTQPGEARKPRLLSTSLLRKWATQARPLSRKKIQVHRLSADFRAATRVAEEPIPQLRSGELLVRRMYAGVNASDVNFTSGRYFGSPEKSAAMLPFDAGFEAVGVVAEVGPDVKGMKIGDAVAEMVFGAYSEWAIVNQKLAIPVPTCAPEIVALLTSGLTASIGLDVTGQMGSQETVLITAAAGGTGQFATQLAKAAGNHVIATCGGREKAELLKRLGADRVINYREESVKEVLRREYKQGVNLVWESVGGEMFDTCVKALAPKGRLIVIGMMSQYATGWQPSVKEGLLELLLSKSLSVRGFFLMNYARLFKPHLQKLSQQWMEGRLQVSVDPTQFVGVERAADAVEHLQTGKSIGKVVVQLSSRLPGEDRLSKL